MIIVVRLVKTNYMDILNIITLRQVFLLSIFLSVITPVFGQNVRTETGNINSTKYLGFSIIIADEQEKSF